MRRAIDIGIASCEDAALTLYADSGRLERHHLLSGRMVNDGPMFDKPDNALSYFKKQDWKAEGSE